MIVTKFISMLFISYWCFAEKDSNKVSSDEDSCQRDDPNCQEFVFKSLEDLEERFKKGGDVQKFISQYATGESVDSSSVCENIGYGPTVITESASAVTESKGPVTTPNQLLEDISTPDTSAGVVTSDKDKHKARCNNNILTLNCTNAKIRNIYMSIEKTPYMEKAEECCNGKQSCRIETNINEGNICSSWNEELWIKYECDEDKMRYKRSKKSNGKKGKAEKGKHFSSGTICTATSGSDTSGSSS
uniref:uncharacterized protein LOC120328335 n=1 Tax=Styela clava TaxID=7725 RepID=UPI0019395E44|nr:uncharacterized protein LOC120328335 [Styela clava]